MTPIQLLHQAPTSFRGNMSFRLSRHWHSTKKQGILRFRIDHSPQLCGIRSSRGTREYNEDRYQRCVIRLGERDAIYVAVFDGHGGALASDYCSANLHKIIESQFLKLSSTEQASKMDLTSSSGIRKQQHLLEESMRLAFDEIDRTFLETHSADSLDGTTASVAVIQALDALPSSALPDVTQQAHIRQSLLTVAHVGDSRILLCDVVTGKAQQLTVDHLPSDAREMDRISRMGGFVSQDAFGELALMGMASNSRSIGVARLKRWNGKGCGLISEPWTSSLILDVKDCFLVLVTDGITHVMNNQEIVDVVKYCKDPTAAAITIVNTAEQFGTEDNITALAVRLAGWPMNATPPKTRDFTQNLRRYKMASILTKSFKEEYAHDDHSEVAPNLFVVDLFDVTGKDIGSSSFLTSEADTDEQERSPRPLGRLFLEELVTGSNALNVRFEKGRTRHVISAEKLVHEVCQVLDISPDFEGNHSAKLSAFDIVKALNLLDVRVVKMSP